MDILQWVMRFMHIFGAVILLGGIVFQKYAVLPALGQASDPAADAVRETLRRRAALLTMVAALLLLVSGLVNTARISMGYSFPNGEYNFLLAVKLLLAFVIFTLASLLSGRSASAQKIRANAGTWLNVLLITTLLLIGVAAAMGLAERVPKDREVVGEEVARLGTADHES